MRLLALLIYLLACARSDDGKVNADTPQAPDTATIMEVRLKEHEHLAREIRAALHAGHRVLAIALALIGASLAAAIRPEGRVVITLLPIALGLCATYALNNYTEMLLMGGYQRRLDEEINDMLKQSVLRWETVIAPVQHNSISSIFAQLLQFTVLVAAALAGYYTIPDALRQYEWVYFVALGIVGIAMLSAYIEMSTAARRAYNITG